MRKTIRNFDPRPVEDVVVAQPSELGKRLLYGKPCASWQPFSFWNAACSVASTP